MSVAARLASTANSASCLEKSAWLEFFWIVENNPSLFLVAVIVKLLLAVAETILAAIFYLFAQFAVFELIIGRRGAIESYLRSFRMVRRNLLETFIFSVLLWIVESVVSIVCQTILLVLIVITVILGILMVMTAPILFGVLVAIGVVIFIIWRILFGSSLVTAMLPAQYAFWNRIKGSAN